MNKPNLKPDNPNFSSGPTTKSTPHHLEYGEVGLLSRKTFMPFFLGLIGLIVNLKLIYSI